MLVLGIDTGGTYTDGVIVERETGRVLQTAKALTTQDELTVGMENCMRALPFDQWEQIGMVGLSTTLATNAIVEKKGCRVGLLLLGARPKGSLPAEECIELGARVDIRGGVRERLDETELHAALLHLRGRCDAVAVSGYASVRNPEQEKQAACAAETLLGVPVVCGHELTGKLGFYERTVTAVLNARLIPVIQKLITTVHWVMNRFAINAPVMIVRGDGSLMRADYAMERPVETVLSGPAASVIGARFLSGRQDCAVVDMGGTTTDVACLRGGVCEISDEGAILAGWKTRVRALQICTFGLGGDSRIAVDADGTVKIGPERIVPLCRTPVCGEQTGLTPTDVLHVTGEYLCGDAERSHAGIRERAAVCGMTAAELTAVLRARVVEQLAGYCRQGMDAFAVGEAGALVGVGAPACVWLANAAAQMKVCADVPRYAEVANAVGAAVGVVCETARVIIRPHKQNNSYYVYTESGRLQTGDLAQAKITARQTARQTAVQKAHRAGADTVDISETVQEIADEGGTLVELRLSATAQGFPDAPAWSENAAQKG